LVIVGGAENCFLNSEMGGIFKTNTFVVSPCSSLIEDDTKIETEFSIDDICPDKAKLDWSVVLKVRPKENLPRHVIESFHHDSGDITVQIGDEELSCHILLLQSYSTFFQRHSSHEERIQLFDIETETFCRIYEWMKDDQKRIERQGLVKMLRGAEYLEIEFLSNQCWKLIQDSQWFCEDQAFLLFLEARMCRYKTIQRMMVQQLSKIFLTVVSTSDFLTLSVNEVSCMLKQDKLAVNSELDVFYAAAHWLLHDWNGRKRHVLDVMECIRFGLIDSTRIVIMRRNEDTGQLREVLKSKELQNALKEALNYAIYREKFERVNFPLFENFLSRFGYDQHFERCFVFDPHHVEWSETSCYSYEDFLNYLQVVKENASTHWRTLVSQLSESSPSRVPQ
jgi:hypothetical protein